ncbi:NAD(P)/FAD-dependent oxidoreductase [Rhodococcus koreensis]|uniref:NAD(P)/FAD-dependent oxidoreductase n=1 Tax=Rhodococcus koreensis TaxID=99653 RepID=UPI003670D272
MTHGHLVVIGGSVAGLMAAAAASDRFERVTVVERDQLSGSPEPRAGVPQGNQVHVILPLGLERMEEVLPGIRQDFVERGCLEFDQLATVPMMSESGWKVRVDSANAVAFRRPLFELVIRERVLALGNVSIRHGSARGFLLSDDRSRVLGTRLRDGSEIEADFVVDASGRRTKSPAWLQDLGFGAPTEVRANAYMGYATQFVRIPEGVLDGALGLVVHPEPGHHRGGVLLPADNGVHSLSAIGMMRDYPPREREGFLDFLDDARSPLLGEIARRSVPVSDINTYHQDGNLRRRWEDESLPDRLLVVGDASASFNPIYGQGMTLAASGGRLLKAALDTRSSLDALAHDVQGDLARVIDAAFSMSAAVDSMFEGSECTNFTPPSPEECAYAAAVEELATVDPEVALAAGMAAFYIDPEVLRTEAIQLRVEDWIDSERTTGGADPGRYPTEVRSTDSTAAAATF